MTEFDFALPEKLIALRPAIPRDAARLLVVRGQHRPPQHAHISDLPRLLRRGDVLVVNDSRVRRLALTAVRAPRDEHGSAVRISLLLHTQTSPDTWLAWARPGKRLRKGDRLLIARDVSCVVTGREGKDFALRIDAADPEAAIEAHAEMPLPPYIARRRQPDAQDRHDYQTMFARVPGSAAAPTAGLHFTGTLAQSLASAGIPVLPITLHTGRATFAPPPSTEASDNAPPPERCIIPADTVGQLNKLDELREQGGRRIAVGTTALRALHAAWADGRLRAFDGETDLFIKPGFRFNATDGLMTNFHLPRSSLFMLVCALMGSERMQEVYSEAMRCGYRFYSYGDACLLLPDG